MDWVCRCAELCAKSTQRFDGKKVKKWSKSGL